LDIQKIIFSKNSEGFSQHKFSYKICDVYRHFINDIF